MPFSPNHPYNDPVEVDSDDLDVISLLNTLSHQEHVIGWSSMPKTMYEDITEERLKEVVIHSLHSLQHLRQDRLKTIRRYREKVERKLMERLKEEGRLNDG